MWGCCTDCNRGGRIEQALRFGNAVAALVVSSPRGVLDSPSLAEVEAFLRSQRMSRLLYRHWRYQAAIIALAKLVQ